MNVDSVTSTYNLKALRQLYDTIESHVRGLKSLGVSADSYGSLLSSVLLNKLPQELRLIVSRKASGDDWEKLMELLEEEEARERAAASHVMSPRKPIKSLSTAAALMTTGHGTGPTVTNHIHPTRAELWSVEERKRVLRGVGRCFVCLRRSHWPTMHEVHPLPWTPPQQYLSKGINYGELEIRERHRPLQGGTTNIHCTADWYEP